MYACCKKAAIRENLSKGISVKIYSPAIQYLRLSLPCSRSLVALPLAPPPPTLPLVPLDKHWALSLVKRTYDNKSCLKARGLLKEVLHPLLCRLIH